MIDANHILFPFRRPRRFEILFTSAAAKLVQELSIGLSHERLRVNPQAALGRLITALGEFRIIAVGGLPKMVVSYLRLDVFDFGLDLIILNALLALLLLVVSVAEPKASFKAVVARVVALHSQLTSLVVLDIVQTASHMCILNFNLVHFVVWEIAVVVGLGQVVNSMVDRTIELVYYLGLYCLQVLIVVGFVLEVQVDLGFFGRHGIVGLIEDYYMQTQLYFIMSFRYTGFGVIDHPYQMVYYLSYDGDDISVMDVWIILASPSFLFMGLSKGYFHQVPYNIVPNTLIRNSISLRVKVFIGHFSHPQLSFGATTQYQRIISFFQLARTAFNLYR